MKHFSWLSPGVAYAANGEPPIGIPWETMQLYHLMERYFMAKTRKSYPRRDLLGKNFEMLTPVEWMRGGYWRCICDCGNETIVDTQNLFLVIHAVAAVRVIKAKTCLI